MDATQALSLIGSALGSAGKLVDLIRAIGGLRGQQTEKIKAAAKSVSDMQEALYAAKDALSALKESLAHAEDRIHKLEIHLAQREQRALRQIGPGAYAYVPQEPHDAVKTGPWFCQPCFDDGKEAVLQFSNAKGRSDAFKYPRCKTVVYVPNHEEVRIFTVPAINRFEGF